MIKTVIFDLDNTLYSYDDCYKKTMPVIFEYFKKNFNLSEEETDACHQYAWDLMREHINSDTASTHNRLIRYQYMLEYIKQPIFPHAHKLYDLFWNTMLKESTLMPGVKNFMHSLKEKNIRIGIGTDMTAHIQYRKLEYLDLSQYIDFIVTSEECGVEKPHPHFFEICIKKADCLPSECAFIGDNLRKDVLGSIACGMRGILYTMGEKAIENTSYPVIEDFRNISLNKLLSPDHTPHL